jgi:hypothetical protein
MPLMRDRERGTRDLVLRRPSSRRHVAGLSSPIAVST